MLILLNSVFFIVLNYFLFMLFNNLKNIRYRFIMFVFFLFIIIFISLIYDFIESFMINKKGFIILLFFSLSPIIMKAVHDFNSNTLIRQLHNIKKGKLYYLFESLNFNYLKSWYILISLIQVLILWSDNSLMNP